MSIHCDSLWYLQWQWKEANSPERRLAEEICTATWMRGSPSDWARSFRMYKVYRCQALHLTKQFLSNFFVCISIKFAPGSLQIFLPRLFLPFNKRYQKWGISMEMQWLFRDLIETCIGWGNNTACNMYAHTHTTPYKACWKLLQPHHDFYNVWHIQFSGPHSQAHTKTGRYLRYLAQPSLTWRMPRWHL